MNRVVVAQQIQLWDQGTIPSSRPSGGPSAARGSYRPFQPPAVGGSLPTFATSGNPSIGQGCIRSSGPNTRQALHCCAWHQRIVWPIVAYPHHSQHPLRDPRHEFTLDMPCAARLHDIYVVFQRNKQAQFIKSRYYGRKTIQHGGNVEAPRWNSDVVRRFATRRQHAPAGLTYSRLALINIASGMDT